MKHLKNFNLFEKSEGLDIKNEYTKLIDSSDKKSIDLGTIDQYSDTDIYNIRQTYKNTIIDVVDGRYIMRLI